MERELNQEEEVLMDLMGSKPFVELSEKEQTLVLKHTSQSNYELQFELISKSRSLDNELEPNALVLPVKEKRSGIVIPLYQAAMAVAAAVVISFFLFSEEDIVQEKTSTPQLATVDTVYVEKTKVDTVVKYEPHYIDKVIVREVKQSNHTAHAPSFNAGSIKVPRLDEEMIRTKGTSVANDQTFTLVENITVEHNDIIGRDQFKDN